MALDGKVFRVGSEAARRYTPPLHINCDCLWVEVGDDEEGAEDWFTPADEEGLAGLVEEHGHFVTNPDKYTPLKVPARPDGRDFTVRRKKDPVTGVVRTEIEWTRPRYDLGELREGTVQTGVAARGDKWEDVAGHSAVKAPPELSGVPGHPELLTETDRARYHAHFTAGPQPEAIPPTNPGPTGHVGSVGEHAWNPASNDPDSPMPEAMRTWLGTRGIVGEEAEQVRRQLYRWSNREYEQGDVREAMGRFLEQAPAYDGRIERHLDLRVVDGAVDLSAYRGGTLEAGGSLALDGPSSFTAGHREPGNVVLVVDQPSSGCSIRGFAAPESVVEDEVVVPAGTEYEVLDVQRVRWLRPGQTAPEELVVVHLRESNVQPRR